MKAHFLPGTHCLQVLGNQNQVCLTGGLCTKCTKKLFNHASQADRMGLVIMRLVARFCCPSKRLALGRIKSCGHGFPQEVGTGQECPLAGEIITA